MSWKKRHLYDLILLLIVSWLLIENNRLKKQITFVTDGVVSVYSEMNRLHFEFENIKEFMQENHDASRHPDESN